ncbi:MAG: thiamine pyrophosphate-dependent dehydrogenase E1 component subunit alpha [Alphaproteobacteria bacterium]
MSAIVHDELQTRDVEPLYRRLRLVRRVEEEIARLYPSDKIKSPVHLSIGQEAVSVGVCDVLRPDDVVSGTYRGHAAYLAKGGDLRAMMAELFGKATGCARGKGGSMHLVGIDQQILGCSAVVGTTIPIALGYALALKREARERAIVVFFGDGAIEEGVFSESLNFAALHRLPALLVCENNQLAIHSPIAKRWATNQLCERVRTYGIPAYRIEDGDVFSIRRHAEEALTAIREGQGPVFLECITYRWREHVGPGEDYDAGYRDRDELEPWLRADQVARLARMVDDLTRVRIDAEIERLIADAIDFAERSPFPAVEELHAHVFSE